MASQPANPDRPGGGVMAILTAYDTSEDVFADVEGRWKSWWASVCEPAGS